METKNNGLSYCLVFVFYSMCTLEIAVCYLLSYIEQQKRIRISLSLFWHSALYDAQWMTAERAADILLVAITHSSSLCSHFLFLMGAEHCHHEPKVGISMNSFPLVKASRQRIAL